MNKTMISAEIVAHSLSPQGDELISVLCTFPRIILAEVNTHRMLGKNTSSSRAIPFPKMVQSVQNDPFIPLAWQKYHSGMQGSEYHSKTALFELEEFVEIMHYTFKEMVVGENISEKEYKKFEKKLQEKVKLISGLLKEYINYEKTLDDWWLFARDKAVEAASILYVFDVTKQLCNRLLEPFMWTTMLITGPGSGWENFFYLRCPSYDLGDSVIHRSRKDALKYILNNNLDRFEGLFITEIDWLLANKGQAEIHIMDLAEKIYDAVNESTPRQLKAGEWHIPFGDKISSNVTDWSDDTKVQAELWGVDLTMHKVEVSTAMAARTSYTVVGDEKEVKYSKMIELHDNLLEQDPPHSSPMEHCAKAMSDLEHDSFIKGKLVYNETEDYAELEIQEPLFSEKGWCRNLKGFIPYRYIVENNYEKK